MAGLRPPTDDGDGRRGHRPDRSDDRGQLILIAAFALAVTFVALALVVNSAIFTENLSSRGDTGGSGDALNARHAVEQSLGEVITTANVHNRTTWGDLTDTMDDAVANVSTIMGRQHAANARYVSVRNPSHVEGTRIADNTSSGSTFEGASGVDRWTVVRTDRTRAFELNVSRTSVTGGGDTFGGATADEFEVNVTSGTDHWVVNLTDRSDTFTVGVRTPSGTSATCAVSGTPTFVVVDLTAGEVNGRECDALAFADGVSAPYDVRYNNSQLVTGNYSLVVERVGYGNAELQGSPGAGDPDDPYAHVAIYASTVRFQYDAPALRYGTDLRVAPGEPDG